MDMTLDIIQIIPLTKETLKNMINDTDVRERINIIKGYVEVIYTEAINSAIKGDMNYTYDLLYFNYEVGLSKQYILELITQLYLVFPDSNIQHIEEIKPYIIIDWS
jgi:hypothetical protein